MREPLVVKLGGRALEAPGATSTLAAELLDLDPCVIVHGGGAEVTGWCRRLGLPQRLEEGQRVTDESTMEVVAAVLAGLANKRLVAALRQRGVDAVGLAALDGGIVEVEPHRHAARLGMVAQVRSVQASLLEGLLATGRVPVLASVAALDGRLFNLNADVLAGALAAALRAPLVMLSDVPGLMIGGQVVPRLGADEIEQTLRLPGVDGGMRPKLRAALAAVLGGAPRAHIAPWNGPGTLAALAAGSGPGTIVEAELAAAHEP